MNRLIRYFLLCLYSTSLVAYSQSIQGTISHANTLEKIEGVNIVVIDQRKGAVSDEEGNFRITDLDNEAYRLKISHINFQTQIVNIDLEDPEAVTLTIQLIPAVLRTNEDVVITAQRFEQEAFKSPEAISIYNQRQFVERAPRSTPEALIGTPGVWVQKTNHGGGSPFLRGLTGNQTLILVDGIRLNNATYRFGPNQYLNTVDPLSLNQIEVVRGSGSVQYGSDALGGVLNLRTKTPRFQADKTVIGGRVYGKYLSGDMEQSVRGEIFVESSNIALLGGFSFRNFGDLHVGGDSIQAPSAYDELAGDIKALIQLPGKNILTLAYQRVDQKEVPRFDQVVQRGFQRYVFEPQARDLAYAKWESFINRPWIQRISVTSSWHKSLEGRETQRRSETTITNERDEVNTWGNIFEVHSQPLDMWRFVSGIEYYYDKVRSSKTTRDVSSGSSVSSRGLYPDNATAHNLAAFSLHTVDWRRFKFTFGGRLNYVSIAAEDETFGDLSVNPVAAVGNLSISYFLPTGIHFIGTVNSGFRAPNINDLSSFGLFDSGIEVPTDDLGPERTLTGEIGIKVQRSKLTGSVFFYYTRLSDLISRVPTTFMGSNTFEGEPVFTKDNIDRARIRGVEAEAEYAIIPGLALFGSIIYTHGETADGDPIRRIPPLNGRLGLHYRLLSSGFWAKAEWLSAALQDRLSGGDIRDHRIPDGGTPGWNIVNMFVGYDLNKYHLGIGIQNIGDELYRIHGSGVDGYGRSVFVSLRLAF